jgi:ABC-type transport system involved in multi-copper enzyme maturation permease subunit
MAPSFTAGSITGEKERKTYEMLLASPLRPSVIVSGKLIAALTHLVVLVCGSLPIIMLCLPLGGVSIYELLAAYIGLLFAIFLFGAISMFCSILIAGVVAWLTLSQQADLRLLLTVTLVPSVCLVLGALLLSITGHRLLYPPDIGSQGSDVIDLENEQKNAVGLVIQRDQFPDNLFAPPRRKSLMADHANPVYDKEMHAELFSQGSLMLRLVIQISMALAIPLMAAFLFFDPSKAAYYAGFVLTFNLLVAPVFVAGSITSERERQTIDLLLTTTVTSWQILWGKLLAGYRVSAVLTLFIMFPLILALVPITPLYENWPSMLAYFGICFVASLFNTVLALFLSTLVRKTSTAMMLTYVILLGLYCLPVAIYFLFWVFQPGLVENPNFRFVGITSPLMAVESAPLNSMPSVYGEGDPKIGSWPLIAGYAGITIVATAILLGINVWLFQSRWRLTGRG